LLISELSLLTSHYLIGTYLTIVLRKCRTVCKGLSVSCRALLFVDTEQGSVSSQCEGSPVLGVSEAALCPLAVPGKARLATAGAQFSVRGGTKRAAATTGWLLPAVVCSSASALACLAATRAAGCLCRACPCLKLSGYPQIHGPQWNAPMSTERAGGCHC